jgi:adenosine kinase
MKILVSGSISYDRIMDFPGFFKDHILPDKIHKLSVSFLINGIRENFGGTAGNIAYSLKLLGEDPLVIATIGEDKKNYFAWWKKNKINYSKIKIVKKEKTASAYIMTDKDDNQITGFHPGSMIDFNLLNAAELNKYKGKVLAIISPENKEGMMRKISDYIKFGIEYIFDPGQQLPTFSKSELMKAIKYAKVVIGNDYEQELIFKTTNLALNQLVKSAGIFIITLGSQGSLIKIKTETIKIRPVKAKKIVDPTGAGDAYRAGFIKGLINNLSLEECGNLGSLAAVYPVEYYGTQEHSYSLKEFRERYRTNFGAEVKI